MYTYCIHIVYTCHNLLGACHNLQTACHNLHKACHNLQVGEKLHLANLAEYPKRAFWVWRGAARGARGRENADFPHGAT